ncbi:TIGR03617 family F420-dependent LLM class oxidoreductase [Nocardia crassostreae]|uniref:TIGR03617 family F420-dependent LLM class oxidoreductase n=1 Tax=Nocardia crassostreae TaxID=53428 RepID=UPI00082BF860|nr:TIGR03617 family F420-dependent LLM class oxidoreductase [Nocardia crassostreae]
MKVDLQLDERLEDAAERARALVGLGADGLFTFEGPNDVFLPLALASQAVTADLMTNIAVALPRSPLHLAHLAHDLHTLSRERFRLGLGSQVKAHIERRYGSAWSDPVGRMRETVLAVNAIFDTWEGRAPLRFEGRYTEHTLMPKMFDPGPNPYGRPEICLGALGPRMTRMAAEVADGLLVMPFNSAEHFRERTLPAVADGLARAGREPARLRIYPQVIVGVGRTPEELESAARGVRGLLAFYGSTAAYRPVLEVEGRAELQPELAALARRGAYAEMTALIDDKLLDTLAVYGTPEQCAATILDRFCEHADRVCCYFPGYDVRDEHIADLIRLLHAAQPMSPQRP